MRSLFYKLILITVLSIGCQRNDSIVESLDAIEHLSDTAPRLAVSMLDSIDSLPMSRSQRHHFDLLTIKSRDKAYVHHTTDSLILDVIDYYSSHGSDDMLAEALYYGGRVYSDLGDLSTALGYFQKALNKISDTDDQMAFKATVLNQTGRLLLSLRLDSAAIGYLEKAVVIFNANDNLYSAAITYELLGNAYLNEGDSLSALENIANAIRLSSDISDNDRNSISVSLAHILEATGSVDSALSVIRNLPEKADSLTLSFALSTAAQIYRDANIPDTAYIYARQLTRLSGPANKRTGYKVIFSPVLRDYVQKDTLTALISEYKDAIEEYLDRHEGERAISQLTKYNYDLHVREREKAGHRLYLALIGLAIMTTFSFALVAWIFYNKYRHADKNVRIMAAINILKQKEQTDSAVMNETQSPTAPEIDNESPSLTKKVILEQLSSGNSECAVNPKLRDSDLYKHLEAKVQSGVAITQSEESHIWSDLLTLIESVSPGFDHRLQVLTEGMITPQEHHLSLLIKCGFSNKHCAILLSRGKSTISSHRRNLAFKITGERKADVNLDRLIISI